ncbi:MAG: hypothetical protein GVY32_03270 [Gammaproteobacteria bacterium]|jgi:hypothetical protein|nr:hypothetical protein [Gammaproteobacteria bacterium]
MKTVLTRLIALAAIVLLLPAALLARPIDADVTGNWFTPGQGGHGLQIEILDLSRAVVAWYTFDDDGDPMWLFGVGDISGDTIRAELSRYSGTSFPPDFEPEDIVGSTWGTVVFRRTGCDEATISYTPEDGVYLPAEFPLDRLTRIDGSNCGGSWSETRRWTPGQDASQAFQPLFLDYPDGSEDFYELDSGYGPLPAPWQEVEGVRISGNNHSDDLKMVLYRPLDGLAPDTSYRVGLEMQFATDVPDDCVGVGGSPGESVYMRLGAATIEPEAVLQDGYRVANLDLGNQANPGDDAIAVGDMANGSDGSLCGDPDRPWRLKRVSTGEQSFEVTSDETGRIWVYGMSDSGFEATSTWYLTEFVVRVERAEN